MILNIVNKTGNKFDKDFLVSIAEATLKKRGLDSEELEIDLTFLTDSKIAQINKKYRNINKPTDVLSFSYLEGASRKFMAPSSIFSLGEIFIAPSVVKKNAKKYKVAFKYELSRVLVHGVLHLLGYDHEGSLKKRKEMEKMEGNILSSF